MNDELLSNAIDNYHPDCKSTYENGFELHVIYDLSMLSDAVDHD